MKSSIAVKFPENFEARVTFTGTGTLDFHSFRVIIEPSTFKLEVESAGKLTTLNGTHNGVISLRHIDSRLYVGDGVKWMDSVYSPEIVTSSKVEVTGGLDVTGLTAAEIFDVYAEPLAGTPKQVALAASWDIFADQSPEATVIDSEYVTVGGIIADIPEAGLRLHTLPMDMRNDFCLAFSLSVDADETEEGRTPDEPNVTVVEQNNFKVRLSGSTFTVAIGTDTADIQVDKADSYMVVIDRLGSQVSLSVNGVETRFNAPTALEKADKAIWFGEGEFEGKFLSLAFIARSVLKGSQPNGSQPVNIPHIHNNISGDFNRKWMRVADSAEIRHTGEEGSSLSIGLRVLKAGDFSLFKDVLAVVGGKLVCSGQELADVELNTDIRISVYFGTELTVVVEGKSATVNVDTIQGDWPGSYAEVFSFASFPGGVPGYPLTAPPGQLSILSNLPGNIQQVMYSREGFESRRFFAYVDRETPGGPWALLISYVGAIGRSILMEDVMSDEIVTDTYTNDESMYPVIPSGLNLALTQIMVKNENPQWINAVGNPVILNNRPLEKGIIGREGVDAYSEAKGNFKLYGPEAGWYSGGSGASLSNNIGFGLMTAVGNGGLCGGANVCGARACLAVTASVNACHFDYVNLKQVYVQAAAAATGMYLQDTSEDSTDEILPDYGPNDAHSEVDGVSLYGLVPGSANALIQAVGPVGGTVPEDNVGWIKVADANNMMFIAKRPLAFGANIPEEKELYIRGQVFAVRSLRSDVDVDEWRDIMYRLSGMGLGDDARSGSLRQFNSDYIGLTRDGVPAISVVEGGRAFKGLTEELTEEQLAQEDPAVVGWRPVMITSKVQPVKVDVLEAASKGLDVGLSFIFNTVTKDDIQETADGYELYFGSQSSKVTVSLDQSRTLNAVGPNGYNVLEFDVRYDSPAGGSHDVILRLDGANGSADQNFAPWRNAHHGHRLICTYRFNGQGYSEANPLLKDPNPAKSGWTSYKIVFDPLNIYLFADDIMVSSANGIDFELVNLILSSSDTHDCLKGSLRNVKLSFEPKAQTTMYDTSERVTDQVLPDIGTPVPYSSDGGVEFFGLVSGNSQAVSALAGFTSGSVQWMFCGWLKVRIDGKLLYIAKKPMRTAVASYANIPNKEVTIDGRRYRLRTLDYDWPNKYTSGGVSQPPQYYNCEWNRIMYRLASRSGKSAEGIPFGSLHKFKDEELRFTPFTTDGSYTLLIGGVARYALIGGSGGSWPGLDSTPKAKGWRPVLELLED